MASLSRKTKNGKPSGYEITISNGNRRQTIYIGKMPKKDAELLRNHIDRIESGNKREVPYPPETAAWLGGIDDKLHKKLSDAGLVPERFRQTLGAFIAAFMEQNPNWKSDNSYRWHSKESRKVIAYLGADTPIDKITALHAAKFESDLRRTPVTRGKDKGKPLSNASVTRILKAAKQYFNAAVRHGIITKSPFANIKTGKPDRSRPKVYITPETIQRLMDACTSARDRLIIGLSRWGGLRGVSEMSGLRWSDVHWDHNQFIVPCTKTKRYFGKDRRTVPLFSELQPLFRDLWESLPEGADDLIFPDISDSAARRRIAQAAKRAGLWFGEPFNSPLPEPFFNFRYSRRKELKADPTWREYVTSIIGHDEATGEAYYDMDSSYDIDRFNAVCDEKDKLTVGKPAISCPPSPIPCGKTADTALLGSREKFTVKVTEEPAGKGRKSVESADSESPEKERKSLSCKDLQENAQYSRYEQKRLKGIGPSITAWEAIVLPLH